MSLVDRKFVSRLWWENIRRRNASVARTLPWPIPRRRLKLELFQ